MVAACYYYYHQKYCYFILLLHDRESCLILTTCSKEKKKYNRKVLSSKTKLQLKIKIDIFVISRYDQQPGLNIFLKET